MEAKRRRQRCNGSQQNRRGERRRERGLCGVSATSHSARAILLARATQGLPSTRLRYSPAEMSTLPLVLVQDAPAYSERWEVTWSKKRLWAG